MKKFLTVVLTMVFTLSMAGMAMAANTNNNVATTPSSVNYDQYPTGYGAGAGGLATSLVGTDLANDNGLINANQTGVGVGGQGAINEGAVKNVAGQRTHGEYANNTNSCASCHQVHTAAGENLLFKDGVYQTCTACHDGTLGVLNVFTGSTAGTFGGTKLGNASMHLADGVMEVKAAPGGNHVDNQGGNWEGAFNCASCHSPHGSYSDRLLKYNPNEIGSTDMYFRNSTGLFTDKDGNVLADQNAPVKTGALKVVGAHVETALNATATSPEFILYRTTSQNSTLDVKVTQESTDIPVIVLMKKVVDTKDADGNPLTWKYVRDITPWIGNVYNTRNGSGLDEMTNFFKSYTYGAESNWKTNMVVFSANPTLNATKDDIIVKFAQAYIKDNSAKAGDLTQVNYGDISRANVVKFGFLGTKKGTFNGLDVKEVDVNSYDNTNKTSSGFGVQISQFCASCHTDYFVSAGTDASGEGKGVWSKAFRHNTTSDSYTCLKCHFAHGTDVSVMLDAKDQSVKSLVTGGMTQAAAENYIRDNNSSSALKRYTNMSVCWKCHTSSHSEDLTNNVWYQGSLNSGVLGSTEFTATNDTNRPAGWVAPTNLPYAGK